MKPAVRRGSNASDKQIAHAVADSRQVQVGVNGSTINGYVMGMDDYHWVVVDTKTTVHLVHKSAPLFTIGRRTLSDELQTVQDELTPMLAPFQQFVLRELLGQTSPRS